MSEQADLTYLTLVGQDRVVSVDSPFGGGFKVTGVGPDWRDPRSVLGAYLTHIDRVSVVAQGRSGAVSGFTFQYLKMAYILLFDLLTFCGRVVHARDDYGRLRDLK